MCVGRYAAKVMRNERSEMEHSRSEMPAKVTKQICIPAGCDYAIKVQLMLSHSYGMQNINISIVGICPNKFERAKGSKRFHFTSLHYIFSAYLPTHIKSLRDFFQSLLNIHRDNLYIISKKISRSGLWGSLLLYGGGKIWVIRLKVPYHALSA